MENQTIAVTSAVVALFAAAAAWGAVFVNRWNATDTIKAQTNIGARNSRAAVVSANRQKWIDAIRDDISEFISARAQLRGLKSLVAAGSEKDDLLREARDLKARTVLLRARVDLRLNHNEEQHIALLSAMERFDQDASPAAELGLKTTARGIFKAEWTRLKKEASGLDPFVREGTAPRKSLFGGAKRKG